MKLERDSDSPFEDCFVDGQGFAYAMRPNGFVDFGDVARNLMMMQSQYGSRYVDGAIEGYPKLGEGLRIQGDPRNYHSLEIHPEDIEDFMLRHSAYQAYTHRYITDPSGKIHEIDAAVAETLRAYLESIGAFDTPWSKPRKFEP